MSVRKKIGKLSHERGKQSEEAALLALYEFRDKLPLWFMHARAATKDEDHRGVDLVVTTRIGKIYIQLKSSKKAVHEARLCPKYAGMLVERVTPGEDLEEVFKRLLGAIRVRYERQANLRKSIKNISSGISLITKEQLEMLFRSSADELIRRAR